jgi:hypothetical protein
MPKGRGGLGFRDMKLFNQALLARQVWRLIQFPQSLCPKLLKAKYYPKCELIDTIFTADPSPTWRAVEHGLNHVKQGIIWQIGPRTKVNIWRDPWIAQAPSRWISLKKGHGRMRWVSQLMLPGRREWDEQMLNKCMYSHDVAEVLKIRLLDRLQSDHISWFYEHSGIFRMKSTYKLVVKVGRRTTEQPGSSSQTDGSRPMFADIWRAKVPANVCIFAWRLVQEGLATQVN